MSVQETLDQIRIQLAAIGIDRHEARAEADCHRVHATFIGRDPSGHASPAKIDVAVGDTPAQAVATRLYAQRNSWQRVGGVAIVHPAPGMELGHLRINLPLATRLRMDHGDRARDVLREALLATLAAKGKRVEKVPRPYGIALDANRLDHREELAPGIHWKGRQLVLEGSIMPDQVLDTVRGRPIEEICDHPVLAGAGTVALSMSETSKRSGGVTVLTVACEWVRGDSI